MSRTVVELGDDSRLVIVSVGASAPDPVRVVFEQPIPSSHTLQVGPVRQPDEYTDGTVTVTYTVGPRAEARFGFRVHGPADTSLPEPTAEVTPIDGDAADGESVTVEWTGTDGTTRPLAMSTETVSATDTTTLPTVTTPVAPTTYALADVAIGAVLTASNQDAVVRTVLRASRRGHTAVVTTRGIDDPEDTETLDILKTLGAIVVSPPSGDVSTTQLHRVLSEAARELGLPGIVLQTRECPRIDYERTAMAFEHADYEVVAIPECWNQSSDTPTVIVGIPAYNAADSIGPVVESALPYADEVVVVDDGSRDETAERARAAGATVVVHERNRGYGGALKTLFREGAQRDSAHLVVIDADGQHDPADIPLLVETQRRDGTDIVIGSRYVGKRTTRIPFVRAIGLGVINNLTNASLGKLRPSGFIRDTQSGYRAYSRAATRSLASDRAIGNNMGASTDILYHAHRNRFSIAEIETTISYEVANASSQGSFSHGLDLLRNILWTVEYGRPMLVLGAPGAVTWLVGIASVTWLFVQYVETGALSFFPLVGAVACTLGGLLVCIMALMMHVLNGHPTMKRLNTDEPR
ncbi:glycosyltransferase family 2 protein [Halobaculum marinum]|uniref:Glycosyltransferase family 2 protein n=1 Tax=Halobaculum marinum TaxID=3031996 RepID=A0ABD5WVB2_9EURY|nr:glycosyltransferase family 2 protein [Halobaculum sp. DT55]